MTRRSQSLCAGIAVTFVAGCASLPPPRPVADVCAIAGRWEGSVSTPRGAFPAKQTIERDGSAVTEAPALPPGRFESQYTASDGKVRFRSKTTGRTGSCSLHEGEGRRVLSCRSDDGVTSVDWTPAK